MNSYFHNLPESVHYWRIQILDPITGFCYRAIQCANTDTQAVAFALHGFEPAPVEIANSEGGVMIDLLEIPYELYRLVEMEQDVCAAEELLADVDELLMQNAYFYPGAEEAA